MAFTAQRGTAVVIGAGIAGLAAARVLADRFAQVTIVDRDEVLDATPVRRGAPQGFHPHVLLASGQHALERLFPGLSAELAAAGAIPFDPGIDLRFYRYGAVWASQRMGWDLISMTRPLLESTIRRRVTGLDNVTVRSGTAVAGLIGQNQRVTGVLLDGARSLPTDLVVDCSGRGSRSDRWLAALGLPAPAVQEVKVGIGYTTRVYRRKPEDLGEAKGAFVLPDPPAERRVGLMLPVEGDRWLVGLGGWHGDHAPTDEEGYRQFAHSLPGPAIADTIATAEPLSDIVIHQFPASRRRGFERLRQVPAGYLAAGDAVCSFNPVYGQGMACAVMEAEELGRVLDRHPDVSVALARDFYRATAKVISVPWRFAVGADFAYPQTTGPRPLGLGLLNAYSRRLQRVAQVDPMVRRTFTGVQHLLIPPGALFTPGMVAKVLRGR